MIKIHAIKPKPLKEGPIMEALSEGMREGGEALLKAAQGVTATWTTKPEFTLKVELGDYPRRGIQATVTTDDLRWLWLDKGTGKWGPSGQPYPITAKPGHVLAFPSAFSPKTKPNSLVASAGSSGPVDTFRQTVMHPGIEPRNFSQVIHKRHHTTFKKAVAAAIAKWARASGHGK